MSAIYYLACRKHGVAIDFWYASISSCTPSASARERPEAVQDFITEHLGCPIIVVDESIGMYLELDEPT
jgi:hypothetical protein